MQGLNIHGRNAQPQCIVLSWATFDLAIIAKRFGNLRYTIIKSPFPSYSPARADSYFQFVVDDNWITDHTAPQETDKDGNVNNVLHPEQIQKQTESSNPVSGAVMSGVTPLSSTVQMAGNVPKEGRPDSAEYPETPFHDAQEFGGDPMSAATGTGNPVNTSTSQSKGADNPHQAFGVAPLPATSGTGNPISLQPGEKVPPPDTFTSNTVDSHVTTDKASYENAGTPKASNFKAPTDHDTQSNMFNLPPVSGNMIPESSLPMGSGADVGADKGPMLQSAGAGSTTAALAGKVPLEPRGVPEVVSESQHEAGVGPEASGNQEAVKEKSAMEKELESKVPEQSSTSDSTAQAAAGGAGSHGLPASVQQSINEMNTSTAISPEVPDTVQKSIADAHQSPEAAADSKMVGGKSAVENELLKDVKTENQTGEPAPSASAPLTETAPTATGSGTKDAPPVTTAAAPAQTPAATNSMQQAVKQSQPDSRDISPMSRPTTTGQTQPAVTTGVGASSAPATSTPDKSTAAASSTPAKPSPVASSSAGTDKKSKRSSGFFGKLKSKFSDKDKK